MRHPSCTAADDLLDHYSAAVGNLGERGEPDILTTVRHRDLLRALKTGQSTHFKHESELHGNGEVGNRIRNLWRSRPIRLSPLIRPCSYNLPIARHTLDGFGGWVMIVTFKRTENENRCPQLRG